MKPKKQILLFVCAIVFFAILECALTPLFTLLQSKGTVWIYFVSFFSSLLAVLPPFLMLGVALHAAAARSFSYALLFPCIYGVTDLVFQLPMTLLSYDPAEIAESFAFLLMTYMLTSFISSLIYLLSFLVGYALFVHGKSEYNEREKIFSLHSGRARALALSALLLTIYSLIMELIDILSYAKDNLYILSTEDIIDFIFFLTVIVVSGIFAFFIGQISPRLLPALPYEQSEEEDFLY